MEYVLFTQDRAEFKNRSSLHHLFCLFSDTHRQVISIIYCFSPRHSSTTPLYQFPFEQGLSFLLLLNQRLSLFYYCAEIWYDMDLLLCFRWDIFIVECFPCCSRGVGCARILFSTLWILARARAFKFEFVGWWWRVCENLIIKDWKNWCNDLTNTVASLSLVVAGEKQWTAHHPQWNY